MPLRDWGLLCLGLGLVVVVQPAAGALPNGTWGWQTVPNVIRADGVESFVVEIETNRVVNGVTIDINDRYFSVPSGATGITALRDDGLGGDRVAGDSIYTSEPLTYKSSADT
ncbi:MAG: choice-of-anchor X domain-containing protein, partial [Planctomycetota bacterium]